MLARLRVFFFSIFTLSLGLGQLTLADVSLFTVHKESAALEIDRVDFATKDTSGGTVPVLTRRFFRLEKDRGLFGPGWCSNFDLRLTGAEGAQPAVIELKECGQPRTRVFHRVSDAWLEDGLPTRILRKPDGRWELTEFPFPIFMQDGKLESLLTRDQQRWYMRRDSQGRPESLDNLKARPVKFRRNVAGDLDSLVSSSQQVHVRYRFSAVLYFVETVESGVAETYEYDADGNILKLVRKAAAKKSATKTADRAATDTIVTTWRFNYTTPDWVSSAQGPNGCTLKWIFDRSEAGEKPVVRETRDCSRLSLSEVARPVAPVKGVSSSKTSAPPAVVQPNGGPVKTFDLKKPGPMGLGQERATVTVDERGFPILFDIKGVDSRQRKLTIKRQRETGSALSITVGATRVSIQPMQRQYSYDQLHVLDDYESWMAAWTEAGH